MATKIYPIHGLGCAHCAAKMEDKIRQLPQVEDASIVFATGQLHLTADDPDALLPQVRQILSSVEAQARIGVPEEHRGCTHCHDHDHEHDHQHHHDHDHEHDHHHDHDHDHGPHQGAVLIVGGALFALGAVLSALELEVPAKVVYLASYLLLGLSILKASVEGLVRGHVLDENFLMSIATIGAFCIDQFPEAVGIMLFYRVGEYFEHLAVGRSRNQIMEAADLRPETVTLADGTRIPAADAKVGDLLRILPGDRIGLDGTVIAGESRLDTAPITGEPVPLRVVPGDAISSGCVNLAAPLTVRVDQPLENSLVSRILHSVEEAAASKPRITRFITRFARIYTPVVVAAAAATALIGGLVTGDWHYWVYTALSFLVMSCPCALVLSVPLAFFSGIGAGSKMGILFKGGATIEALAGVRVAVMDKTGTLTHGDFAVRQVVGPPELLALCAGCEQLSTHPIAKSIVAAAQGLDLPQPEALEELPGLGLKARCQGSAVLCGNEKLMAAHGIPVPSAGEGAVVHVARDGQYLGYILVGDQIKEDAPASVQAVRAMGIRTAMLTGDRAEAAQPVARALGIEEVHAQLLPQEKLERLRDLRARCGPVLYVGDGINDAPVLSNADVGAAMGSGADAALEAADLVFLTSRTAAIPQALKLARRTRQIALQNVVFALGVKALVMILGLTGQASLWAAVFADTGVSILCVLNSLRLLYTKK